MKIIHPALSHTSHQASTQIAIKQPIQYQVAWPEKCLRKNAMSYLKANDDLRQNDTNLARYKNKSVLSDEESTEDAFL